MVNTNSVSGHGHSHGIISDKIHNEKEHKDNENPNNVAKSKEILGEKINNSTVTLSIPNLEFYDSNTSPSKKRRSSIIKILNSII